MLHRLKPSRLVGHREQLLTNFRALHAQQQELQRHKLTDSLNKAIASRPEKDELVERNILPDSTAAPSLQNHQRELAAAMRRDSIERHLQTRPSPAELIKEGILEGSYRSRAYLLFLILISMQPTRTPLMDLDHTFRCESQSRG
jgi:hypothetical protein